MPQRLSCKGQPGLASLIFQQVIETLPKFRHYPAGKKVVARKNQGTDRFLDWAGRPFFLR
jgi:hypothetical protein